MRPKDAWLATQGQLELQLSQSTYDTWVRECKYLSYENGIFIISVRNAYAKDWLENKLYRAICHTLSDIFRQQVDIRFVVSNPVQSADDWEQMPHGGLPLQAAPYPVHTPQGHFEPAQANGHWASNDIEVSRPVHQDWDPSLRPTYTFESFVVGPSNQMAQAAAQAVSRGPGEIYNPLFIYGNVGLGKTHLLHAIGNECWNRGLKVLYTSSEAFTNHLVESIRNKSMPGFREHFRQLDVLLIDDVQFIAGKESTQEEFFHTFNALHDHRKQVVLAADRPPSEIRGLENRLVSRLEWGLQVDVQSPTFETRLAIVHDKSEMKGHRLPNEVAELVAQRANNVRVLEGMVTQLIAYGTLMQRPLTIGIAEDILSGKSTNSKHKPTSSRRPRDKAAEERRLSLEEVLQGTATALQLSLDDLVSKRRTKEISMARQWAIYLAREETQASWPEIGGALGGRNHSTMLYSYNKIAEQVATDPEIRARMAEVRRTIHEVAVGY